MSSSSSARISISSDEVNVLIYRYLIEAGFKHTAFVFHGESLLHRSPALVQADLPPGALVSLLQKALLFLFVESHVSNDGKQIVCDEAFSLLKPHDHDHGPIEAAVSFEPAHVDPNSLKRADVGDEVSESHPSKKSKAFGKKEDFEKSELTPNEAPVEHPTTDAILEAESMNDQVSMEISDESKVSGGTLPEAKRDNVRVEDPVLDQ